MLAKFRKGGGAGVEAPASKARTVRYAGPECEKATFFGRSRDAKKFKRKGVVAGEAEGGVLLAVCPWHLSQKKGNRTYHSQALVDLPQINHVRAELRAPLADPLRSALYVWIVTASMGPEAERGYLESSRISDFFERKGAEGIANVLGVARVLVEAFDGPAVAKALATLDLPPGAVEAFVTGYEEAAAKLKTAVSKVSEADRKFYVDAPLEVYRLRNSPQWKAFDAIATRAASASTTDARSGVVGELTTLRAQLLEACPAQPPVVGRGTTSHPHGCISMGLYSAIAQALTTLYMAADDTKAAAAEVIAERSFGIGVTLGWEPHIHYVQKKYLLGYSGTQRTTRSVDKFYRLGRNLEKKHRKALPLDMVRERVVGTKKQGEYVRLKLKRPKDYRCDNWKVEWRPYRSSDLGWTFDQYRRAGEGKVVNGVPMVEKSRRCTKVVEIKGRAEKKVSSLLFPADQAAEIRKHDYIWFVCTAFRRQGMHNAGSSYCVKSEQTHSQIIAAFRPQCRAGYTLAKKLGKRSRLVCSKRGDQRPAFRILRQVRTHPVKADFGMK